MTAPEQMPTAFLLPLPREASGLDFLEIDAYRQDEVYAWPQVVVNARLVGSGPECFGIDPDTARELAGYLITAAEIAEQIT